MLCFGRKIKAITGQGFLFNKVKPFLLFIGSHRLLALPVIEEPAIIKNMKNKDKELLKQAEKNGLFKDIICLDCDETFDINWRNEKIDNKGVWYHCPKCGSYDVMGWDVINSWNNK